MYQCHDLRTQSVVVAVLLPRDRGRIDSVDTQFLGLQFCDVSAFIPDALFGGPVETKPAGHRLGDIRIDRLIP